eukprot:Blabericola_migrator_1__8413@NODE_4383_length_1188_cov_249_400535_g2712_i0_p1_GENE_NODE_4383_length_1188_cov_249_400535_g2712_i0NODE_4383_length_1188_cov_249_400535_g2712_i0_p1_ORF_typecomplete_len334_score67_33Lysine_decarbox/PF03641_14/9_1e23LDcluster4/PF18306_1/8_2e03LDcluster4/PF18306_1/6_1e15ERCC4/PF02732_15/0_013DUF1823/PF08853_11/0_19DSHCT/PF08148_12/0_16_NODE_4383_length_1188_cov_249_400535_g2712_i0851086
MPVPETGVPREVDREVVTPQDPSAPQISGHVPHEPISQGKIPRAFENPSWLRSREARLIRILSEFMETQGRLRKQHVTGSIVFFGSARLKSPEKWTAEYKSVSDMLQSETDQDKITRLTAQKRKLERVKNLSFAFYHKVSLLAELVTRWAQTEEAAEICHRLVAKIPELGSDFLRREGSVPNGLEVSEDDQSATDSSDTKSGLVICTGGGPGMMEAANAGASRVPGGRSIGMGITLPFEAELNPYVDPALALQYHYFFTRKFWMIYMAMGVVAAPGGLGTLDELMEILTLRQTGRFKKSIPIVMFGKEFWQNVVNFDYLCDNGLIDEKDKDKV